jgi:pyridoxal phosphate enzyme (YggS family)
MRIAANYRHLREEVPDHVTIIVAAKTRSVEDLAEVIDAGATDIGENYVQETEQMRVHLAERAKVVRWHMIGHLQTNKISKAIEVVDIVQTVDSLEKAAAIGRRVERARRQALPILLEINIGSEFTKAGIRPDAHEPFEPYIEQLVTEMSKLKHVRLEGLMTMGPRVGDPESNRPYFRRTRGLFERLARLDLPGVQMRYLSMGMTNSYQVAIEEGANMIRIGTAIFGPRSCEP